MYMCMCICIYVCIYMYIYVYICKVHHNSVTIIGAYVQNT